MNTLKRFLRGESGQDMVEYGLLAAFLSIVTVAVLVSIRPKVTRVYNAVYRTVYAAVSESPTTGGRQGGPGAH